MVKLLNRYFPGRLFVLLVSENVLILLGITVFVYVLFYADSAERTAALDAWLYHYNFIRPHGSLSHKPPGSRLTKAPGNYS